MPSIHALETPDALGLLLHQQIITERQYERCQHETQHGSNVTNALHLFCHDVIVWRSLAERSGMPYYADAKELKVMFTDLFPHTTALQHALLPHRSRGAELQVLTYDPSAQDGIHAGFPGWILKHALVAPSIWRQLYLLAYPKSVTGALSDEQAQALITYTRMPERPSAGPARMTAEQRAELLAMQLGFRYIDLRTDPVDDDVRHLINISSKATNMVYPHHLEGSQLIMLMVNPTDAECIRMLSRQTQLNIVPAIVTEKVIHQLLEEESRDSEVSEPSVARQSA